MNPEDRVPASGAGRRSGSAGGAALRVAAPARGGTAGLAALLGALAVWGGWFIFRTSFVIDGRRVFCLFDDAMISMTYARNLVEGYGLNWARQGAPVEGFTHPLWTALMVPVNALPIGLERRSLVVQVGSLALLLVNVVLIRRLMLRHFTRPAAHHWWPACVATAFYYPLVFWSLVGMETGLQAVLTTALVLLALDVVHGRRDRHLALLLAGTVAVLLRPDMALLVVAALFYVLANGGLRAAGPAVRRGWLLGLAALAAAVSGYTLFRWVYFHDLLPNTYYLKLQGIPLVVRLLRGGDAMLDTLRMHWPLLLAVAIGVVPQLPWLRPRDGESDSHWGNKLALPAAVFVLCCAYSVYVGGDAWEEEVSANRFVVFAMPLLFVLFNALANQALAAARRRRRRTAREPGAPGGGAPDGDGFPGGPRDPLALRCALLAATAAALLAANGLWQPESAEESWRKLAAVSRPTEADKYREIIGLVRLAQKLAAPSAVVAVTWAGTPAYFSDFRMVDTLGYNDRHIAREKPARELTEDNFEDYVPGHAKWDYAYLLRERRPDIFLQTWGGEEVTSALRAHGYRRIGDLWIDPASPRVHLGSTGAK
ncbi:MAG TPA: hypothetical protein VHQ90_07265 [Thermoanaerobaculia bacterium]|nr:hypothetical protein [Thermoanaerobaculia bacterium]